VVRSDGSVTVQIARYRGRGSGLANCVKVSAEGFGERGELAVRLLCIEKYSAELDR